MSYLIDTHVLLWWLFNDPKLCAESRDIISDPAHRILVSSATAWEIATKYRIGIYPKPSRYCLIIRVFFGKWALRNWLLRRVMH